LINFVTKISKCIIIIVNELTISDQELINKIQELKKSESMIFIIHNFKNIETEDGLNLNMKVNIIFNIRKIVLIYLMVSSIIK
jgi:hypothetical protein